MAYLDETALGELWARIGEVFARKTEALGSIILSGTSLISKYVSGETADTIDLDATFATDTEAAAASGLSSNGTSLTLSDCDGTQKSSVNLATMLDSRYGGSLSISGQTLTLKAKDGTSLNSVTLPTTDTAPIYDYVKRHYAASVNVQANGSTVTVTLYDGEGHVLDYDSATITIPTT